VIGETAVNCGPQVGLFSLFGNVERHPKNETGYASALRNFSRARNVPASQIATYLPDRLPLRWPAPRFIIGSG
jgi:hypothetical protein